MRKSRYLVLIATIFFISAIFAVSNGKFSQNITDEETQEKYNYYDNPRSALAVISKSLKCGKLHRCPKHLPEIFSRHSIINLLS